MWRKSSSRAQRTQFRALRKLLSRSNVKAIHDGEGSPNSKKDVTRRWMSWLVELFFVLKFGSCLRIFLIRPRIRRLSLNNLAHCSGSERDNPAAIVGGIDLHEVTIIRDTEELSKFRI